MFASLLTVALAASSVAAAPLEARKPGLTYQNGANDNLEPYEQYHARYRANDCKSKHDLPFFNTCCRPLRMKDLNGQTPKEFYANQSDDKKACYPGDDAIAAAMGDIAKNAEKNGTPVPSASASSAAPAATSDAAQPDDAGAEYFADAGASSTSTEAPKPSPTEEAKQEEPKQEENKNQGSGTVLKSFTGGKATHFTPWDGVASFDSNAPPGHCGYDWQSVGGTSGHWVALKTDLYKSVGMNSEQVSVYCKKKVKITNKDTGAVSYAGIVDSCPSCSDDKHIDVSPSVFNDLQTIVTIPFDSDDQPSNDPGELNVDWEVLDEEYQW